MFSGLGIDLSDHHLRLSQASIFGHIGSVHEIELPEGLVVDEAIVKQDELKKLLAENLTSLHIPRGMRTTVLVPESRVFSHGVLLDGALRGGELRARARQLAQREIPVPFAGAQTCVSEVAKEGDKIRATVYVAPKEIFAPLSSVFQPPACAPIAMEANSKALLRLLQRFAGKTLTAARGTLVGIVDVGHSWTSVSLYTHAGSSVFSRTIPHHLKGRPDPKDPQLPERVVDSVVETVKETVLFFEGQQMKIGQFVFAGVEAQDDRLKEKLAKEQLLMPIHLVGDVVAVGGLSKKQVHTFGAAIGAAVRAAFPLGYSRQHNFLNCS